MTDKVRNSLHRFQVCFRVELDRLSVNFERGFELLLSLVDRRRERFEPEKRHRLIEALELRLLQARRAVLRQMHGARNLDRRRHRRRQSFDREIVGQARVRQRQHRLRQRRDLERHLGHHRERTPAPRQAARHIEAR